MEVECLPDDEEDEDACRFDWEAGVSPDGKKVMINAKFENPPSISQGEV